MPRTIFSAARRCHLFNAQPCIMANPSHASTWMYRSRVSGARESASEIRSESTLLTAAELGSTAAAWVAPLKRAAAATTNRVDRIFIASVLSYPRLFTAAAAADLTDFKRRGHGLG